MLRAITHHMKLLCIGGGTGLFTLLSGLKDVMPDADIGAIVTMTDSGGSTGRLRDEFGHLPAGDIRQCLVALSEAPDEMRLLMQHRFNQPNSPLHGHVIGNLMLTALKDMHHNDDYNEYTAIESMERLLRIKGKVYPVTLDNSELVAILEDGSIISGEKNIDVPKHNGDLKISNIMLQPMANIFEKTKQAILDADYITIGPGDLYTSILPNLIVNGMRDTLKQAQSKGTKIIYITNTMTKYGETNNYSASDFVAVIERHINSLDAVIVNTQIPSNELILAYANEKSIPVQNDLSNDELYHKSYFIVDKDLLKSKDFARHDSKKLSDAVNETIQMLELNRNS